MLPPVAPGVLVANPKFRALYQNIASSRLNPDASTRLIKQQRAQAELEKQLLLARQDAAKHELLQDALRAVAEPSSRLPDELIECCHIVSAHLAGELTPEDHALLSPDLTNFTHSLSLLSDPLSNHLSASLRTLTLLLHPSSSSSSPTIGSEEFTAQITALQDSIPAQSTALSLTRQRITELADALHATYRDLLAAAIRILEQLVHGAVARGQRARAEHLATVATGMHLKLRILSLTDPVLADPALQRELGAYLERLGEAAARASLRKATAELELAAYRGAGEGMPEIARLYAGLLAQCEEVKGEIARLER